MSCCNCNCHCGTGEVKCNDYYWKDYTGYVPNDALPAGKDINDCDVYIGQVYMHEFGLFVAQIHPGQTEVEVPCCCVQKTDKAIKILCTQNKGKFSWLKTGLRTYHTDTSGKHAVVGGYDHRREDLGVLHVGRVMLEGMLKIGMVTAYNPTHVFLVFPHRNKEIPTTEYEVLINDT